MLAINQYNIACTLHKVLTFCCTSKDRTRYVVQGSLTPHLLLMLFP